MARSSHKPEPGLCRQVEALAAYGTPESNVASVIGIDPKTLRKHYRDELDNGHVKANAKVAENLFRKATGEGREAVTAAIFWLKTRAGWKETALHEVSGRNGGPIEAVSYMLLWPRRSAGSFPSEPVQLSLPGGHKVPSWAIAAMPLMPPHSDGALKQRMLLYSLQTRFQSSMPFVPPALLTCVESLPLSMHGAFAPHGAGDGMCRMSRT